MVGAEDRHFHDLRHEGVSRLFEICLDIPRASSVSGHRDGPLATALHPSEEREANLA